MTTKANATRLRKQSNRPIQRWRVEMLGKNIGQVFYVYAFDESAAIKRFDESKSTPHQLHGPYIKGYDYEIKLADSRDESVLVLDNRTVY